MSMPMAFFGLLKPTDVTLHSVLPAPPRPDAGRDEPGMLLRPFPFWHQLSQPVTRPDYHKSEILSTLYWRFFGKASAAATLVCLCKNASVLRQNAAILNRPPRVCAPGKRNGVHRKARREASPDARRVAAPRGFHRPSLSSRLRHASVHFSLPCPSAATLGGHPGKSSWDIYYGLRPCLSRVYFGRAQKKPRAPPGHLSTEKWSGPDPVRFS